MGSKVKKVVKSVVKPIKKIVSSPVGQLGLAIFAPQFLPQLSGRGLFFKEALNRALVNAAATKLSGGDVDLKSSLIAGGIGAAVPNIPGISEIQNPALQRAAIGSLTNVGTNLATGRDVNLQQAALSGGLSAGVGALQDRLSPPSVIPGQEGFDSTDYLDGNEPIDASKLEGITGGGEEDRFGGDYSEPIKGIKQPFFRTAAIDASEAETAKDFAEAEASRTVSKLSAAGDPVGLGGVPIGSVGDATSFSDVTGAIKQGNISEAVSKLTAYATDKQNAPKVLLGAITAAPLFFSPKQQENETAEAFTQRRADVTKFLRQYGSNFYSGVELDDFISRTTSNLGYASGGRVDYAEGSKDKSGIMMASAPDTMDSLNDLAQMLFGKNLDELTNDERDALDDYNRGLMAKGGMPTGIMKTNAAGIKERDYRETGGFVPVGIKEKADDVPAMLSKNEFVMTADAVRGAGNGSIEKGAQKMYDTMKELENRVA